MKKKPAVLKTFQQYKMFKTCAQIAKHSAISLNRIRYFEIQKNRTEILMFCRASVTEFLRKSETMLVQGSGFNSGFQFPQKSDPVKNGPDPLPRLFEVKC